MNVYKSHRKLILYSSTLLISILLIIFIPKILILFINFKAITLQSIPLLALIVSIVCVYSISYILKKLDLYLPRDLVDFLSAHNYKIKFYNVITKILKLWNMVVLVLLISMVILILLILFMFLVGFILLIINTIKDNSTNIPEFLSNNSVIKYALIVLAFSFSSFFLIALPGISIFAIVFPQNKSSGLFDTSDIPISFIAKAIDEINSFSFSLPWEDLQQNRKKISNLIHDALEFITVEDKFFAIPLGMRYSQLFISGLKNKAAKTDILYRINGLTEELGEIIIKLNCMNSARDKEEISNDLKEYLKIIEDRNLCEIKKKVKYKKANVIWKTTEKVALNPLYYIMKIIFRF
ncbi:MAG: hypothetical protein OIN66_11165 [Candidatus Methanoperedens sp.]|nr:hypothetical protein [Candidatus Methanoperedens sp.]